MPSTSWAKPGRNGPATVGADVRTGTCAATAVSFTTTNHLPSGNELARLTCRFVKRTGVAYASRLALAALERILREGLDGVGLAFGEVRSRNGQMNGLGSWHDLARAHLLLADIVSAVLISLFEGVLGRPENLLSEQRGRREWQRGWPLWPGQ